MKEFFELLWLSLVVKKRLFVEQLRIIFRYYHKAAFRNVDIALLHKYLFHSPYAISKRFLLARGESDVYTYGETPLTTLDKIARECEITTQDRVFELGCGRGRGCFWLNRYLGCKAVGIEYIPDFVARANEVKELWHVDGIEFRLEDILEADYTGATVIYLYGTCYEEAFLQKLIKRLAALPQGTKIITVSYPLTDFEKIPSFEVTKSFEAPFTWGTAEVFLQVRKWRTESL
ncbi:MAG: class I SAM-dependent methyltransferase [Parachlamydia sp.]|nr:class I SAM-dependent methyltransferase [Parachlamydia sp.]